MPDWYSFKYPDFEITDSVRELCFHGPCGEAEESALSRCEYYLRRLHILYWVLIAVLWGAATAYRVVTGLDCRSAFLMLGILSALELAGMIAELATVRRKVAATTLLEETELPSKRGLLFFKMYGFYLATAVQESAGVIVRDVKLYREEYESAACGKTMYVFKAGVRYVAVVGRS